MTRETIDALIERLSMNARPVRPLRPPSTRALATLGMIAAPALAFTLLFSDPATMRAHADEGWLFGATLVAMLATGVLAVIAAFNLSIPGRPRQWLVLPLAPFFAWLSLSGAGCYRELLLHGPAGWGTGHGPSCFVFILATGTLIGIPLIWRLSRSAPIDPLPVTLLGGLGTAALAAFLLQFFHPFAVTFVDLAFHLGAIAILISLISVFRRRAIRPA